VLTAPGTPRLPFVTDFRESQARGRLGLLLGAPAPVTALLIVVAYALFSLLAFPLESAGELVADDAVLLVLRLGIALVALAVARDPRANAGLPIAWRLFAIAFLVATLASALRLAAHLGMPFPGSLRLALAIPQFVLMPLSLWMLARLRRDAGREADWLDAAIIVLAGFLLATEFIAHGNPFMGDRLGALRWFFLLFLWADVLAVFLAATAWFRRPADLSRDALGLLTLGFAVVALADLQYDQALQRGTYQGGGPLDVLVALGFALIIIALDRQRRLSPIADEPRTAIRESRHIVAPIAIVAAVIPILFLAWNPRHDPQQMAFQVSGMTILLILVLVRQHLVRRQTLRLARERIAADARFRSLVQRSSDAILQISPSHLIEWASPSASELAGTIPTLLVGHPVSEFAHPEDRDRLAVFLANAAEPFARNAALRWRMGRGERWHDVESVVSDLTADDGTRSVVLNTRNVTERVRLEQQLRQAQKLEAVGRLAGGIAHDFNNILAAIITHAQLVQEMLPVGDERAADLREIEETAQRGAVLTRRLLSFSRPEAGQLRTQQLGVVMRGMEPMLRRLLVGQVDLELDLAKEDLWVRTADGQIEQILMNLAINARDAMPEGGVVRVRTRALTVRPGDAGRSPGVLPGHWADLTVRDDGVGMDQATMDQLFEPFFTTKPSGLGTGLGLTTVRGIVRSLGGQVLAESTPGIGTTMRVLLPLAAPETATAPSATVEPPVLARGPATVMVVDDELALRRATERYLERSGYAVIGAPSAVDALAMLDARAWQVDLVVTDMVMPGMDGRELVRRIGERRADLPVICMSGHMDWASSAEHPSAPWGPERLLAKPFAFSDLLRRVREALGEPTALTTTAP
jgi:PAS domain S-box-containing protein